MVSLAMPTAAPTRQPAQGVLAGVGVSDGLLDVLDRDETAQVEVLVDDQ